MSLSQVLLLPTIENLITPTETEDDEEHNMAYERFRDIASVTFFLNRAMQQSGTGGENRFRDLLLWHRNREDPLEGLKSIYTTITQYRGSNDPILESVLPTTTSRVRLVKECLEDRKTVKTLFATRDGTLLTAEILLEIEEEESARWEQELVDHTDIDEILYLEDWIETSKDTMRNLHRNTKEGGPIPEEVREYQAARTEGIDVLLYEFECILTGTKIEQSFLRDIGSAVNARRRRTIKGGKKKTENRGLGDRKAGSGAGVTKSGNTSAVTKSAKHAKFQIQRPLTRNTEVMSGLTERTARMMVHEEEEC